MVRSGRKKTWWLKKNGWRKWYGKALIGNWDWKMVGLTSGSKAIGNFGWKVRRSKNRAFGRKGLWILERLRKEDWIGPVPKVSKG